MESKQALIFSLSTWDFFSLQDAGLVEVYLDNQQGNCEEIPLPVESALCWIYCHRTGIKETRGSLTYPSLPYASPFW